MRFIVICIFLFFIPSFVHAQSTWYVPDHFTSIQGAINDPLVLHGDTVIVRPGTYYETLDFLGKAITLKSEFGPDQTTVNGFKMGSVVHFHNGETTASVLNGFTLTNGTGEFYSPNSYGGGIGCWYASPTIINNKIIENTADHGAGIYFYTASPEVRNNTISDNRANTGGGITFHTQSYGVLADNIIERNELTGTDNYGAGIYCHNQSAPTIIRNTIRENTALGTRSWGGGIECMNGSDPLICENLIDSNWVSGYNSFGGGIDCDGSSPILVNNIICHNGDGFGVDRADYGGGISVYNGSPRIVNNTICKNAALKGGGIYSEGSSFEVINTILWNNDAPVARNLALESAANPSTVSVKYSNLLGIPESIQIGPGCTLLWGSGMIEVAPCLDEHCRLLFISPCIDAGDNQAPSLSAVDIDGQGRIVLGIKRYFLGYPVPTPVVDMGADEFWPRRFPKAPHVPAKKHM